MTELVIPDTAYFDVVVDNLLAVPEPSPTDFEQARAIVAALDTQAFFFGWTLEPVLDAFDTLFTHDDLTEEQSAALVDFFANLLVQTRQIGADTLKTILAEQEREQR